MAYNRTNMKTIYKGQKNTLRAALAFILFGTLSCSYDFPEVQDPASQKLENADISNTVFIGGSLFSGVSNGALVEATSSQSIPQIFLNSITESTEGQDFSATSSNQIGFNIYANQNLNETVGPYELVFPNTSDTTFFQRSTQGEPFAYSQFNQSIKNYSFPKSQVLDYTQVSRTENGFINSYIQTGSQSLADQIAGNQPSFFVANIGYEDVLGFALNGAQGTSNQSNASIHNYEDLLTSGAFEAQLELLVDKLLNANPNAKGALCTIPNFLDFPFFRKTGHLLTPYIDGNPRVLQRIRQSATVYSGLIREYNQLNPGANERRPSFTFGPFDKNFWGVVVTDSDLADVTFNGQVVPKVRHAQRDERFFYPNERFLLNDRGTTYTNAFSENEYLKVAEVALIQDRIQAYNQTIVNYVNQHSDRVILIDLKAYFDELYTGFDRNLNRAADGVNVDGVAFLPIVGEFGIFSADGLNLNPRGNALIVNQIIETLNTGFNGNLKKVNPNGFEGTPTRIEGN